MESEYEYENESEFQEPRKPDSDEEKKDFRLSCKHLFITYSQAEDLTKEIIRDFIKQKFGLRICSYIIAEERHEDGGKHFHILVSAHTKFNIRDARILDIGEYHPSMEAARGAKYVEKYLRKEDNSPMEFGLETDRWITLAEDGKTRESLDLFKTMHPLQYTIHLESIRRNITYMGYKPQKAPYKLSSFRDKGDIERWDTGKCLIISGDSGIGKTKLAMALAEDMGEEFCFVRHQDGFKNFEPGQVIIFDDFDFRTKTREETLHMIDTEDETQINVKHSMIRIPPGTMRIITTNFRLMEELFPIDPYKSLDRRIQWWLFNDFKLY